MTSLLFGNSYVMARSFLLSGWHRFYLKTQSPPAGLGRRSLSARLCISSWARTISSSESCAQRRSCSRSAPSQVVRLQSIASSSLRGIGKLSQILDVDFILRSAGDLFHPDERWDRDETHCDGPEQLYQGAAIFLVEVKRLGDEYIHGCVPVAVAPEVQHGHALIPDPRSALRHIGKVHRGYANKRPIADPLERAERRHDVLRSKLQD